MKKTIIHKKAYLQPLTETVCMSSMQIICVSAGARASFTLEDVYFAGEDAFK